jgi:hypothetical protein
MDKKTYFTVTSLVFLIIAVVHALRVLNGWGAMIGGWPVPMAVSYAAVALGAYLAWTGYRFQK